MTLKDNQVKIGTATVAMPMEFGVNVTKKPVK